MAMAKMWIHSFKLGKSAVWGNTSMYAAREILRVVAEFDPPPKRLEYVPEKWVEVDFSVEADDQLNAIKAQNRLDEKLRDAPKGQRVNIRFSNPIPGQ